MVDLDVDYDDKNLQQLFAELEPKRRLQAIKGGFRREAREVRKSVIGCLRKSLHSNKDLEKGVRALTLKRKAGFRVTIGTKLAKKNGKGEAGFHVNRQGLKKPILIWADSGTKERKTKGNGGRRTARLRSAHRTGRMPRFAIIAKASKEVNGTVTANVHKMIAEDILRVAKKYGCK